MGDAKKYSEQKPRVINEDCVSRGTIDENGYPNEITGNGRNCICDSVNRTMYALRIMQIAYKYTHKERGAQNCFLHTSLEWFSSTVSYSYKRRW